MQRNRKLVSVLVLAALLLSAVAPVALAQFTPLIFAVDQNVIDGVVNVTRVTSDGPGWVVIHADANGKPGDVLGYAPVAAGIAANVKVTIDTATLSDGSVLHPMLHVDKGVEGTYEFPGADVPAMAGSEIVMVQITAKAVGQSLKAVAAENSFNTFLAAVEAAGLTSDLASGGPYTVFAPTDAAFDALPAGTLDALLADPEALSNVLLYHVVPGILPSEAITESMPVATVQGDDLDVQVSGKTITVNGAGLTSADLNAYNGVIHGVDAVLLPPVAAEAPAEEATPEAAATAAVTETVAATETAAVTESAAVTGTSGVEATEAITESATSTETSGVEATAAMTETLEPAETMVHLLDAALEAGQFSTFLAAVQAAGLDQTLTGEGPYTVFAPTDDAFAKIPGKTLDDLLADPEGSLKQILLYHVVPGRIRAADLSDGMKVTTMQGDDVIFSVQDGVVKVNDATVVRTDVAASNGVLHVVDTVLMPPTAEAAPAEAAPAEAAPAEAAPAEAAPAEAAPAEAAPAELPATGAAQGNALLTLAATLGVLLLLAVAAAFSRRRTA